MPWKRLGLLIAPPANLSWAASHAAVPVVDDVDGRRLRVYFTSRDELGRSHVARAQLSLDDPAGLVVEPEPLLAPGALGGFDDRGAMTSCLVERDGRSYLFYTGWNQGVTVPFYAWPGLAISDDGGATFRRASRGPIFDRDDVDPFLAMSPWVLVENGVWRMWYSSATAWEAGLPRPRHRYHVRYAESDDGIGWRRAGHVCIDYRDDDEYAIGRPCVVKDGAVYRMWFSYRGDRYRIGYAESADGLEWTRFDDHDRALDVSDEPWESEMVEYGVVFAVGEERHMLYNGNGYGKTGIGHALLVDA